MQSRDITSMGSFSVVRRREDPANMGGHAEIHFVSMFGVSLFYNCMIDKSFRHVVGDQFCPYFLLDVFGLTGMKVAQPIVYFSLRKEPS